MDAQENEGTVLTVLGEHFVIQHEIVRTEVFTVYRVIDLRWPKRGPLAAVVYSEQPIGYDSDDREWLKHVRLSDFGSHSRRVLSGCKGKSLLCGCGSGNEEGIWYSVWEVNSEWIQQPYRPHEFSAATRRTLIKAFDGHCQVCGMSEGLQIDHIIPIDEGGTEDINNGAVLCRRCHEIKSAATPYIASFLRSSNGPPYHILAGRGGTHDCSTPEEVWRWVTLNARQFLRIPECEG